jgi:hypothetical protein
VIQRLLKAPATADGGGTVTEDGELVILFARIEGEPYQCCGRLSVTSFELNRSPVKFTWGLLDYESLISNQHASLFKELL